MRGAKFQFESMQTYKARPLGQTSNSVESKKVKRNLSGWLYASFEKVPDSIFRKKINRKQGNPTVDFSKYALILGFYSFQMFKASKGTREEGERNFRNKQSTRGKVSAMR